MKNIVIRGYYGRDNLGDELMKEIFIKQLSGEKVKLFIMNSSPHNLKEEYGIDTPTEFITGSVPSFSIFLKRFNRILKSDLYVYGGGTILTDKHSYKHLMENLIYFFFRKIIGKKNLLISVGATKFKSKKGRILAKQLIKYCSFAYIRDEDSFRLLKDITNNSKHLVQSADMVLMSKEYYEDDIQTQKEKVIGLCVMPYYYATYHDESGDNKLLEELVRQILIISKQKPEYRFVLIPIQSGESDDTDSKFSKKVQEKLGNCVNISVVQCDSNKDKIREITKCEYLISMRLHALMLAKLAGVKVFAINHNEKIGYFVKHYDSEENEVDFGSIEKLSERFVHMNENIELSENLNRDYLLSKENISIIKCLSGLEEA